MAATSGHKASSSMSRCTYQVFLSFRGQDTRKNFTGHLYTALVYAGFHTFLDNDELERGQDIQTELVKALQQSKISIIVFSKDYASSRWCLDELVKILERNKTSEHMVLPVFYDVDPSQVRNQTGSFADSFARHEDRFKEEMDKVNKWREALRQVANLGGMVLQNQANGHESQFIQIIVGEIRKKLSLPKLCVPFHQIGIYSRAESINLWLRDGSTDVGIGLIYGMGGIGKTTIAKTVYNLNFDKFEGSSFLANVREALERPNGLVRLQAQLLSDILKGTNNKIYSPDEGTMKIKNAVCCKRVLVVLDDVDRLYQLDAILGMRDWFYPRSKIIITTRHERLLKSHEVCQMFKVEGLDDDESLELFSWHAFGQCRPIEGYMEHSRSVVQHCGGLPLALQVLGSSLSGRSVDIWESALQKLEVIFDDEILKILKISYDSLHDDHDKNIFLDISCFFIGKDKDYTIKILDGCDLYATIGIANLVDRCLLTIDKDNKLMMHQLLRDMGREIVRQESPKKPGERSRLWSHRDAYNVLTKRSGTDAIEGLILNFPMLKEDMQVKTIFPWQRINTVFEISSAMSREEVLSIDGFATMHKLRLLQLNFVRLTGGYEAFPKDLRYLCWRGFPLKFIPNNFQLDNLVALDMRNSSLKYAWKGTKFLLKLRILNLSHSHALSKTPTFSGLPSLERLILKDCKSLVEVHESIGDLQSLVFLNLKGCKSLVNLPRNIVKLNSLQELILSGCSKLIELPEALEKMESLRMLNLDGTAVFQLPSNPGDLTDLSLSEKIWHSVFWSWVSPRKIQRSNFSLACLPRCLVSLSLVDCKLSDNAIPNDLSSLPLLQFLDLSKNLLCSLPESINYDLSMLHVLLLDNCTILRSLPELPTSLEDLQINDCTSLERITNLPNLLRSLYLGIEGCSKLVEVQGLFKLEPVQNIYAEMIDNFGLLKLRSIGSIEVEMFNNLTGTKRKGPLQGLDECGIYSIFLPGSEIPERFSIGKGVSSLFNVPLPPLGYKILGLNICIVYKLMKYSQACYSEHHIIASNVTKGCKWAYSPTYYGIPRNEEDMLWLSNWKFGNQLEGGDILNVTVRMYGGFKVKKWAVNLVCEEEKSTQSNSEEIISYTSTYELGMGQYFFCNHKFRTFQLMSSCIVKNPVIDKIQEFLLL